ncbi:hypothetical protein [Elizabethkingia miricola]|uniref:hypothetical protein n=1 Tax=Elizabethkingia miricola TaxID=172045 RepID=UPI00099AAEBA|nr:hypothetical protein [Elizabethkingia miricola]OPC36185.1 hypothetical protein BAX99_19200 [Elizabethkingia miricola]
MDKTTFIIEKDNRGRYEIIEGWVKPGNVFSIKHFICQVQQQETDKETKELAELILAKLKS